MKCHTCRGFGWTHPNFKPCPYCEGRGRVGCSRATARDLVATAFAIGVGLAVGLAVLFL